MAKVTAEGAHGHVYQEDDTGVIVAGWCLGDQPWRPRVEAVPDERAYVILSHDPDCPYPGRHDPIKITETISADDPLPATVAEIDRLLDSHTDAEVVVTRVAILQATFGPAPGHRRLLHVAWPDGQPLPLRAPDGVAPTHRNQ